MDYIKAGEDVIKSKAGISAAFGYGSSFFHQAGYNSKTVKSMDFIFVVDDIKKWLTDDIKKNPDDYTKNTSKKLLKMHKKSLKGCTGVIYNVVRNRSVNYKFGVIERSDFISNLKTWNSFYVTGRMQKPIYTFKSDKELDEVIDQNRRNVLIAALLILNKSEVSLFELFETICSLSYKGDIRFIIENPNKVSNIVKGSIEELTDMYSVFNEFINIDGNKVLVNMDSVYKESKNLPVKFKSKDVNKYGKYLIKHIKHVNFKESIFQPLKGLRVSGIKDSLSYVLEKARKKKIK